MIERPQPQLDNLAASVASLLWAEPAAGGGGLALALPRGATIPVPPEVLFQSALFEVMAVDPAAAFPEAFGFALPESVELTSELEPSRPEPGFRGSVRAGMPKTRTSLTLLEPGLPPIPGLALAWTPAASITAAGVPAACLPLAAEEQGVTLPVIGDAGPFRSEPLVGPLDITAPPVSSLTVPAGSEPPPPSRPLFLPDSATPVAVIPERDADPPAAPRPPLTRTSVDTARAVVPIIAAANIAPLAGPSAPARLDHPDRGPEARLFVSAPDYATPVLPAQAPVDADSPSTQRAPIPWPAPLAAAPPPPEGPRGENVPDTADDAAVRFTLTPVESAGPWSGCVLAESPPAPSEPPRSSRSGPMHRTLPPRAAAGFSHATPSVPPSPANAEDTSQPASEASPSPGAAALEAEIPVRSTPPLPTAPIRRIAIQLPSAGGGSVEVEMRRSHRALGVAIDTTDPGIRDRLHRGMDRLAESVTRHGLVFSESASFAAAALPGPRQPDRRRRPAPARPESASQKETKRV